jgi:hypothetical protein
MTKSLTVAVLLASALGAQDFKIPVNVEKLAAKAVETVDVTLDAAALQLAGRFLSERQKDESEAKKLVEGLKGIYVRSFEFAKPGEYTQADVDSVRAQLKPPVWSRIVGVQSKKDGENAEVFVRMENSRIAGLAVIAAEPTELTIVHISGNIDPEALGKLGGQFGIPKVEVKPAEKK